MYSTNNKNLERQNKVEEQNIIIDPTKTCNVWIDDLFLPQGSEKECLKRWKNARKPWENQQPIGRKKCISPKSGDWCGASSKENLLVTNPDQIFTCFITENDAFNLAH